MAPVWADKSGRLTRAQTVHTRNILKLTDIVEYLLRFTEDANLHYGAPDDYGTDFGGLQCEYICGQKIVHLNPTGGNEK